MVTFSFFLLTTLLSILLALFDMKIYEYSFFEAIKNLFYSEIAVGRYISVGGAVIGLIASVIIDIRIYRSKKESNTNERTS